MAVTGEGEARAKAEEDTATWQHQELVYKTKISKLKRLLAEAQTFIRTAAGGVAKGRPSSAAEGAAEGEADGAADGATDGVAAGAAEGAATPGGVGLVVDGCTSLDGDAQLVGAAQQQQQQQQPPPQPPQQAQQQPGQLGQPGGDARLGLELEVLKVELAQLELAQASLRVEAQQEHQGSAVAGCAAGGGAGVDGAEKGWVGGCGRAIEAGGAGSACESSRAPEQACGGLETPSTPRTALRGEQSREAGASRECDRDEGGGDTSRKEMNEVRQRARRLLEAKDKEVSRLKAQLTQMHTRLAEAEKQEAAWEREAMEVPPSWAVRTTAPISLPWELPSVAVERALTERQGEAAVSDTAPGATGIAEHGQLAAAYLQPTDASMPAGAEASDESSVAGRTTPRSGWRAGATTGAATGAATGVTAVSAGTPSHVTMWTSAGASLLGGLNSEGELVQIAQQQAARDAMVVRAQQVRRVAAG